MAIENFNIYRCIVNKDTGELIQDYTLIEENIAITDTLGVYEYIDDNAISNNLYGYVIFTVAEVNIPMYSDIYVHYFVDFLVVTLGTDMTGLEMGQVRLHGEITEMTNLPIVNLNEFDSTIDTVYASLINISGLSTVDVYFEYRKGTGSWSSTAPQALIATGTFNSVITVLESGTYYIRGIVEFTVNTKTYKLVSNAIAVSLSA